MIGSRSILFGICRGLAQEWAAWPSGTLTRMEWVGTSNSLPLKRGCHQPITVFTRHRGASNGAAATVAEYRRISVCSTDGGLPDEFELE
jgi:hypothetical protein